MKLPPLDPCLGNLLDRHKPPTESQELELLEAVARDRDAGEPRGPAWQELVLRNLRLATNLAMRYQRRGVDLDDLVMEAVRGLMVAIDKFDLTLGKRFTTYAVWWIRQKLLVAVSQQSSTVRLPINVRTRLGKLAKVKTHYVLEQGRPPKPYEVAKELDWSLELVERLIGLSRRWCLSLSAPVDVPDTEEQDLYHDLPDPQHQAPYEPIIQHETAAAVWELLRRLSPRERKVVRMRFGLDCKEHTLQEVANELGVTRERVRQIQTKALAKLRRAAGTKGILELVAED